MWDFATWGNVRMPYKKAKQNQIDLYRLLKAYEIDATRLSKMLGCSFPTAKKKLDDPGKLTVDELMVISTKGHVAIERIREAIG